MRWDPRSPLSSASTIPSQTIETSRFIWISPPSIGGNWSTQAFRRNRFTWPVFARCVTLNSILSGVSALTRAECCRGWEFAQAENTKGARMNSRPDVSETGRLRRVRQQMVQSFGGLKFVTVGGFLAFDAEGRPRHRIETLG